MTETKEQAANIRALAMEVLLEIEKKGTYSHLVLSDVLQKYAYLPKRDRAFLTRLVEGTLEYRLQLDAVIDRYAKTPVKKQKPLIRTILRMGVYQLLYMDGVPASAVCNESVKLAVSKGFGGLKGFVNGVLRAIARALAAGETLIASAAEGDIQGMSVQYAMPQWIIKLWLARFDAQTVRRMLAGSLTKPPLTVRCRTPRGSMENCDRLLAEDGVTATVHPYLPYALVLREVDSLTGLRAFAEGCITVQDVSSMLAAEIAAPQRGDTVIDVCAAPGGKSLHMADCVGSEGVVYARDVSEYKAARIRENVSRLGCENVIVQVKDACIFYEEDRETADVVLADVPCSGLGVLARKKELRYRVQEGDIAQLVSLQRQILDAVWRYVKPGGVLLYSTCTVSRAENEGTVQWFCERYPFVPEDLTPHLPEALAKEKTAAQGYLQLLPGIHACDGFFLAKLRRKN